jgi:hypothetical protein
VPDCDLALRRGWKIDAVIASAVTDDRAELRHLVHHGPAQGRAAGGDHRADAGKLFRREHLMRRLARGVHQLEALPDAHHHRLGEARIDQNLLGHRYSLSSWPGKSAKRVFALDVRA